MGAVDAIARTAHDLLRWINQIAHDALAAVSADREFEVHDDVPGSIIVQEGGEAPPRASTAARPARKALKSAL